MDKSKELEIIAKYNLDNKTNFYKMDQVLDHIYKNTKSKDNALSRIAAGQIAQTEGPGATIGSDIASGKVDNVQDILTKYGISPEDAKQYSLNTARDKDTKSTKQAAGITTTAMMTALPILDIAKYGIVSGLGRNVAGAIGGAIGGYYGSKADEALNTNFLGFTGGLLGGGLGYGAASFRPHRGIEVSKPYVRVAPSDGRQQMAINYYFKDRPKSYFQVIKDTEPNNYSIHFKTNRGDYSSQEVQDLINKIVADLPENANIATWGTVSKGGFSGLNRFQAAGMQHTGQFRRLSFKDPSIADEIAAKYGVTLNADGTVNWPILTKNYTGFTPREDFTISATPVATRSTGRTNYSLLERPSRISTSEKLGLSKGDRGNLSRYQKEALDDLEYLINATAKKHLVLREGTPTYTENVLSGDQSLIKDMLDKGATYREGTGFILKTPTGNIMINPAENGVKFKYSANFGNLPGDADLLGDKIILTSPIRQAQIEGLSTEGIPTTIPKNIMKNFWTALDTYTPPGTYVSGDQGRNPLGYNLWKLWTNRNTISKKLLNTGETQLTRNGDLNSFYKMLQTQPKVFARDEGLSVDSYMAILKQGNRPGHRLRFSSDGFNTFNNQGVENKWISDLLEASKRGEVTPQEFINQFNNWVAPYNGMPAVLRNGEISIPHPFILYKFGGKL